MRAHVLAVNAWFPLIRMQAITTKSIPIDIATWADSLAVPADVDEFVETEIVPQECEKYD